MTPSRMPPVHDDRRMRRPPLSEVWGSTNWGDGWAIALTVMVLGSIGALIEGWPLSHSVIFGLLVGPGWLVVVTVVGLLSWMLGWGYDDRPL